MATRVVAVLVLAVLTACSGAGGGGGGPVDQGTSCPAGPPPLAEISPYGGYPAPIPARQPVTLGSQYSYSYVGLPLTRSWSISARPAGSVAATIGTSGSTTTFDPDVAGSYVVQLVVTDCRSSSPSTVTIVAQERAPVAVLPATRYVQLPVASPIVLDGSASHDDNGDPMTFAWTLTTPSGSAASLSATDQATASLLPDAEGIYTAALTVTAGGQSDAASMQVRVYHPVIAFDANLVDADYSGTLDRVVVATSAPAYEVWIIDPHSGATTAVALDWAPKGLSLTPDGLHAAVSHSNHVTVVDLEALSVTTFATGATYAGDLVITGARGTVYQFPGTAFGDVQRLDLATGTCTSPTTADANYALAGSSIGECKARLDPSGQYIFRLDDGGDRITRYPVPVTLGAPYVFGTSSKEAGPWLTQDGSRVFVGTGEIYSASTLTATGGTFSLAGESLRVDAAAHSTAAQRIVVGLNNWGEPGDLRIYDDAAMPALKQTRFSPAIVIGGTSAFGHSRAVFWNRAGSRYYVIVGDWGEFGMSEYTFP
jgi:hypothetical protein